MTITKFCVSVRAFHCACSKFGRSNEHQVHKQATRTILSSKLISGSFPIFESPDIVAPSIAGQELRIFNRRVLITERCPQRT